VTPDDRERSDTRALRVLRVYHSAVVTPWRRRDRELRALGAEVTLVSPRSWNEGGRDVMLERGPDETVVEARTVGHHPYLFAYDPRPIWRTLRSAPFDVIDAHEEPASIAAAEVWLLSRIARRRAPMCLYSAQNIAKRYPVPFRWIERAMLRRAAGVHTCNRDAGRILRGKGFSGVVRDLGLGVDLERFAPSVDGAEPAAVGPMRVGYVGRLEAHKGVGVLVRAVARTPGVTLEIVGAGPEQASIEDAVNAEGLAGRVVIAGFADPQDLPDVYRRFDVLAVPSLDTPSWLEQFGRVAVEAMASGVAVVASRSGALPDVIGDAGLLVPPGDAAALADALARLRDDSALRTNLVAAGRARAAEYAWPEVARRQLDFYRKLEWFAP
jgi:glycosyltransferase involved in cell wall biosynthesis